VSRPTRLLVVLALAFLGSGCQSIGVQGKSGETTRGINGTGASGGAISGSGGGSSSSGGTATGGQGCDPNITSNQLDFCSGPGTCGCPYHCVDDPLAVGLDHANQHGGSGPVCEVPCSSSSDCLTINACLNGACSFVACGGNSGNGTYNSTCTSPGSALNAGSCYVVSGAGAICVLAGAANASCDPSQLRSDPQAVCAPGFVCESITGEGQGMGPCVQMCDDLRVDCPLGQYCNTYSTHPTGGLCFPLADGGN
jgi:hypothetical protein